MEATIAKLSPKEPKKHPEGEQDPANRKRLALLAGTTAGAVALATAAYQRAQAKADMLKAEAEAAEAKAAEARAAAERAEQQKPSGWFR